MDSWRTLKNGAVSAIVGVFAVSAAACKGNGSLDDGNGPGSGQATDQDGGAGASADASAGACSDGTLERRVWTLSRSEYDNSVKAVLGDSSNQAQATFPPESRANGFSKNAQAEVVNSNLTNLLMTAAETIAAANLASELAFIGSTLKCVLAPSATAASPDPCAVSYIKSRGAAFFRRPLTEAEADDLYATYLVGFGNPYTDTVATSSGVELVVATLLQMPQFLYRTELGAPTDTASPVQLTQYEIASAVSFVATGAPPDATLLAAAEAGALTTSDAIAAQYKRLLATPGGHTQTEQFVLEWLGADQIAQLGSASGPTTPAIAKDMLAESQGFIEEAVFNGAGTVEELLTGGYTFANAELAAFYGLPASGLGSTFAKVSLSPSAGRAGILSQGAFLASNSTTGVPLLHRGRMIRNKVLCETLPSVAAVGLPGFTPPPFVNPPVGTTTRQEMDLTTGTGACHTCHQYFQPLGEGLENFDAWGRFQTKQNGGTVDPSGQIFESSSVDPATGVILAPTSATPVPFADYPGLAAALASQPRVSSCFASQVVSFASGRSPALNDCAVANVQSPTGTAKTTIQQQFLNYVQSKGFVWRTR